MILHLKGAYSVGDIKDVKFGDLQVNKVYSGSNLVFEKIIDTTPPVTTVYPDPTNPDLIHNAGTQVWLEVNEMCTTYYTLDGTEPTTSSAIFREAFTFNETTTIKYFSVDVAGNTEAVKTTVFDITENLPVTTISPSSTIQSNISVTVTLSSTDATTTYYRVGTGSQQTYTNPFTVYQWTAGVQSANIPIYYWSVGPGGTEAEKSIIYDTSSAVPSKPVGTATNGQNQVILNWNSTTNTTAYTIYRSTVQGSLGSLLAQFLSNPTYTDNTAVGGTTYYYTVRSQNYGPTDTDSDQIVGVPTSAGTSYRYLKIEGYGATETGQTSTTRIIEFEAYDGATNLCRQGGVNFTYQTISLGSTSILTIADGVKTTTSNSYPIWTSATPNANVVVDFGSVKNITKLVYISYSTAGVPRANRFRILGSNTNNGSDWVELWDMSANATTQPFLPSGYEKVL